MTTEPTIALKDLIEKGADADLLRQMIGEIVQQIMAADVENLCNASCGERSAERANSRNGYRERLWETRAGSIGLSTGRRRQRFISRCWEQVIFSSRATYGHRYRGWFA